MVEAAADSPARRCSGEYLGYAFGTFQVAEDAGGPVASPGLRSRPRRPGVGSSALHGCWLRPLTHRVRAVRRPRPALADPGPSRLGRVHRRSLTDVERAPRVEPLHRARMPLRQYWFRVAHTTAWLGSGGNSRIRRPWWPESEEFIWHCQRSGKARIDFRGLAYCNSRSSCSTPSCAATTRPRSPHRHRPWPGRSP